MLTKDEVRGLILDVGGIVSPQWDGGDGELPAVAVLWKALCRNGVHDYEFVVINQRGAKLRCYYCGHEKISTKLWMKQKEDQCSSSESKCSSEATSSGGSKEQ